MRLVYCFAIGVDVDVGVDDIHESASSSLLFSQSITECE